MIEFRYPDALKLLLSMTMTEDYTRSNSQLSTYGVIDAITTDLIKGLIRFGLSLPQVIARDLESAPSNTTMAHEQI